MADPTTPITVNPGVYNGSPISSSKTVATTAGQLLPANPSRTYLRIQNQDATNPVYINYNGVAAADGTSYKLAAGATDKFESGFIPSGAVSAISTGGSVVVNVLEGS